MSKAKIFIVALAALFVPLFPFKTIVVFVAFVVFRTIVVFVTVLLFCVTLLVTLDVPLLPFTIPTKGFWIDTLP